MHSLSRAGRTRRVRPCALPHGAILGAYLQRGAYTDCYAIETPRAVTQREFVEAFYTTPVFKAERWLLARFLAQPSTDAQVREVATGNANAFSAWSVERREADQILLAAGRTRSWLMTTRSHDPGQAGTRLYFGSAIVPRRSGRLGWRFHVLLGFHKVYSRVLLRAASRKLKEAAQP